MAEHTQSGQYRQGDVLLIRVPDDVKALPHHSVARDEGRIVLAYGEATGHAHAIAEAEAELIELETGERFLVTSRGVSLRHEEHDAIELTAGTYRVVRQREYVPAPTPEADLPDEEVENTRYVAD